MEVKKITFSFDEYKSAKDLNKADAMLLSEAKAVTKFAYAPYSNFHVGAAALLQNGVIVRGTNQENASYPAGICAERALLSSLGTQYPDVPVVALAVSYDNKNGKSSSPISPCGICRQYIAEYEQRFKKPIRVIMGGLTGKVYIIKTAKELLPLTFTSSDLKK